MGVPLPSSQRRQLGAGQEPWQAPVVNLTVNRRGLTANLLIVNRFIVNATDVDISAASCVWKRSRAPSCVWRSWHPCLDSCPMLPVLTTPLALFGLLALPALAAIYLLHNRSRPRPVSSLLLWTDARVAPEGGRRVDPPRPPLAFWLELLALLLLVLAAAGPQVPANPGARPLVVVLDDSFSMLAGGADSSRKRAADALLD